MRLASNFDFLQLKIWDCISLSCPKLPCMIWFDDSCKNSSYGESWVMSIMVCVFLIERD